MTLDFRAYTQLLNLKCRIAVRASEEFPVRRMFCPVLTPGRTCNEEKSHPLPVVLGKARAGGKGVGIQKERVLITKKHSVWYDFLPHHFLEFDVWDRKKGIYLSTAARKELLAGGPVLSVPVLFEGIAPKKLAELLMLLEPSHAKTKDWRKHFEETVKREQLDVEKAWKQCDKSEIAEGLYIKVEQDGETVGRFKWVRADFVQAIIQSDKHHSEQPFVPNLLAPGVDIFAPTLTHDWDSLKALKEQLYGK